MMAGRREDGAVGECGVENESCATVAMSGPIEGDGMPWISVVVTLGLLFLTFWYFSWGPHPLRQLSPSPSPGGVVGGARPTPTAVLPIVSRGATGATGASPAVTGTPQEGLSEPTDEVPPPEGDDSSSPDPESPPSVDDSGFPPAASPPPVVQ